jgi:hypothetical protein
MASSVEVLFGECFRGAPSGFGHQSRLGRDKWTNRLAIRVLSQRTASQVENQAFPESAFFNPVLIISMSIKAPIAMSVS